MMQEGQKLCRHVYDEKSRKLYRLCEPGLSKDLQRDVTEMLSRPTPEEVVAKAAGMKAEREVTAHSVSLSDTFILITKNPAPETLNLKSPKLRPKS